MVLKRYRDLWRGTAALVAVALMAGAAAKAADQSAYLGKWDDLASGLKRIGNVDIKKDKIIIGKNASYIVSDPDAFPSRSEEFSDGEIFKVTGVNKDKDPFGCGVSGKVHYIVLLPRMEDATRLKSFQLLFYGGSGETPNPDTLTSDRGVCDWHYFGKFPN
jgi:hypothetical protein